MKTLFLSLFAICVALQLAQAQRFKPHVDLNLGMGMLPTFVKDYGKSKMLPLSLSGEYKFTKNFSLGLAVAHSVTDSGIHHFRDSSTAQWRNHFSTLTLRAAAQSSLLNDSWNIYGGLNIGFARSKIDIMEGSAEKLKAQRGIGRSGNKFLYTAFLGTRYCLGARTGLFGEIGFGISLVTIGVSVRL